jgi:hypothetical protein
MATITLLEKPNAQKKVRVEIDLDQWERIADVFGMYNPNFIKTLDKSLMESKQGKVRKIRSLRELR